MRTDKECNHDILNAIIQIEMPKIFEQLDKTMGEIKVNIETKFVAIYI